MSEFMLAAALLAAGLGCELIASCDSSEDAAADPRAVVDASSSQESSDAPSCLLSPVQTMADVAAEAWRRAWGLGPHLSQLQGAMTHSPWTLWGCTQK